MILEINYNDEDDKCDDTSINNGDDKINIYITISDNNINDDGKTITLIIIMMMTRYYHHHADNNDKDNDTINKPHN